MAMVRDGIVEASVDPALMRVKASTHECYVPEVFYKYKNEYGRDVQGIAKPTFPVEYLLVSVKKKRETWRDSSWRERERERVKNK